MHPYNAAGFLYRLNTYTNKSFCKKKKKDLTKKKKNSRKRGGQNHCNLCTRPRIVKQLYTQKKKQQQQRTAPSLIIANVESPEEEASMVESSLFQSTR